MKYSITHLTLLVGAVAGVTLSCPAFAGTRKSASSPTVITPPAVPNGSNLSRAPFPAARPQNDVTPPNGEAFDQNMAPNTPSTTPAPEATPPARVAILQPRVAPGLEPGLMPTGRSTTSAAVALDAARLEPTIRASTFESRDQLIGDLRARVKQSDATVTQFRHSENEMSTEGRAQFQSAADDVKAREKALQKSLRAAEHASSANWDSARAQLSADYDAYAAALTRLDATIGVAPAR